MADNLIKTVSEMLNEEKWTRAALNNYTINHFTQLDAVIAQAGEAGIRDEVSALCDEHLQHTKNSIIALYMAGVNSLNKHLVDDTQLIMLITIFADNHKWNIVEYLCNRILDFGENKFALRTLAECYVHKNEEENKYLIWERLIKVDYDEADIVRLLAEKKEAAGDKQGAVEYYKKALHRYINKKLFANVKDVWVKLLEHAPDDIDFFFSVEKKIEKLLNSERALSLLELLYPIYKEKGDWEAALEISKRILQYNPKDFKARKELIACYKEKYAQNAQVDEYIKLSNLGMSWRNVHEAIADFEKHISFEVGNHVYHRSWGVGKITAVKDDVFVIDFPTRKNHKMSLKMAVSALGTLKNDHIWVLKLTMKKEELADKLEADPVWALKMLIRSFGNSANLKEIKKELTPEVLSAGRWARWSSEARKILKTDPSFGNDPDKPDQLILRTKPISFEEKIFNKFKADKDFFSRAKTLEEFLENADPDSEFFGEMFTYFASFLKSFSQVNEFILSSFLMVQKIVKRFPFLNPGIQFSFEELFRQTEEVGAVFARIDEQELRKEFLIQVKLHIPNWPAVYSDLFPHALSRFITDELAAANKIQELQGLFETALAHYKEYRESFIWLVRNVAEEPWFRALAVRPEKILICLVHLLDITFREIDNRRDASLNRKLNKQIQQYLFSEGRIESHLATADEDSISRIFTLIEDVKILDPSIKIHLKQKIKERFPEFHFLGEHEIEKVRRGLLVTHRGYEEKHNALKHIIEVEIPDNSKEIGTALQKGDLRENAEYKAALERQELLKSAASKLQEELQNAQMFDESAVDLSVVGFGCRVELLNQITGHTEEYTIYGPWESDPAQNIISYLSPLGTALCNHHVGEELHFTINEKEYQYKIIVINKA
jgi:transcription elongation factor GreA